MVKLASLAVVRLFLLVSLVTAVLGGDDYTRADFPADFIFGSGTAAPQYEGAAFDDGRTPSIWDTFAHSGRTNGNGDVACDGYHKYKVVSNSKAEDIRLMVDTGLEAFRLSISWSRLIPNGRGPINPKGLQYYNNLINELISSGEKFNSCKTYYSLRDIERIQPHVTLSHIDLPQALEDEYGGWLSRKIVKDFVEFADVCFKEFGDRVLHWTTLNEVNIAALGGYDEGIIAPAHCSTRSFCSEGDSTTEPYKVVHNMLLAHSAAAKLYREKYKVAQNGMVGLNIYALWFIPYSNSTEDSIATQRAKDFYLGWVIDPLTFGDYPDVMKKRAQARLPNFTKDESEQIKGSSDFIGVNHYTTVTVKDASDKERDIKDFYADMEAETSFNGALPEKYPVAPEGLNGVLQYLKENYGNPPVYIQENGQMARRNGTLNDTSRVEYLQAYIGALLDAVRNGSNTKGYFVWTFLDCLELLGAYRLSFGLYYVDLDDKELARYQKLSARWYANFLKGKSTTIPNIAITQVIKENMLISST